MSNRVRSDCHQMDASLNNGIFLLLFVTWRKEANRRGIVGDWWPRLCCNQRIKEVDIGEIVSITMRIRLTNEWLQ